MEAIAVEIAKLELKDGDILVFRTDYAHLLEGVIDGEYGIPDSVCMWFLPKEVELSVISKAEQEEQLSVIQETFKANWRELIKGTPLQEEVQQ